MTFFIFGFLTGVFLTGLTAVFAFANNAKKAAALLAEAQAEKIKLQADLLAAKNAI